MKNKAEKCQKKIQQKSKNAQNWQVANSNADEESTTQQCRKVKVVIEGRTLLIPIQSTESNIEWLGTEVAKRFADRCGKPLKALFC